MAYRKVLYVTGGPSADPDLDLVKALSYSPSRGVFTGTGDNALAVHAGRANHVTGTAVVEDYTTSIALLSGGVYATAAFTGVCDADGTADTCAWTFTNMVFTGYAQSLPDGRGDEMPVPGISLTFEATDAAEAAT